MKNKLFFTTTSLTFLFLLVFGNGVSQAQPCDPAPQSIYHYSYNVVWHKASAPTIYFGYTEGHYSTDFLVAEFDSSKHTWLFYGYVPDEIIRMVHRHWQAHRQQYWACMGYRAQYYFKPYRHHYTYDWYQYSPGYKGYVHHPHRMHYRHHRAKPRTTLHDPYGHRHKHRRQKPQKFKKRKVRPRDYYQKRSKNKNYKSHKPIKHKRRNR